MDRYSISFTLGKASDPHGANLAHNNRKFTAANVHEARSGENITYIMQDVRDAYEQLFAKSVAEYNAKQRQPCRRIHDYYAHIANGNREEPYYEVVVQFGDMQNAPCGSARGEIVREMLDEFMRGFQERNPNLFVFNAVLHLDEASPHLHIDFIPYYTQGKQIGLSKGVSMKAALDEMGFRAKGHKLNRLVTWEERERMEMEHILQQHGYAREDKNAHYAHMTVEEYKLSRDSERMIPSMRDMLGVTVPDDQAAHIRMLQVSLRESDQRVSFLEQERSSPYKGFFYSSQQKQAWVMRMLEEMDIPYRETDNGFEAQECYVQLIRRLEKEYKAPRSAQRDKLREDIDRLLMQSRSFPELIEKIQQEGYTVKQGKYLSVKPEDGNAYIRLKSLGEYYTEFALRNRIAAKLQYEKALARKISEAKRTNAPTLFVLQTMQLYTVAFSRDALPIRRRDHTKPFSWTNDAELDRLLLLNKKISEGATLETLRCDFAEKEIAASEKSDALEAAKEQLQKYLEMKEQLEVLFAGKKSAIFSPEQAQLVLRDYPAIDADNWQNVDRLIEVQEKTVAQALAESEQAEKDLREAAGLVTAMERITGGTYVQSLVADENDRRNSNIIPNGIRPGGGAIQ